MGSRRIILGSGLSRVSDALRDAVNMELSLVCNAESQEHGWVYATPSGEGAWSIKFGCPLEERDALRPHLSEAALTEFKATLYAHVTLKAAYPDAAAFITDLMVKLQGVTETNSVRLSLE